MRVNHPHGASVQEETLPGNWSVPGQCYGAQKIAEQVLLETTAGGTLADLWAFV
jgi:hypothetical protein